MLLVQPIERDGTQMPSPAQLKRRIIIKHKKLPDGHEEKLILSRDEGIEVVLHNDKSTFLIQKLLVEAVSSE
ncbi:hypothetical protein AVEN_244130-1 [Araneus ventricosus]|uniref:Uncharacterized protein n=1 Tax=Araneus ventricosus TaxID=182803 RepID=A0A4Y2SYK7_ARAVE